MIGHINAADNTKKMEDCPRFDRCSSNICPLDGHINRRDFFPNEKVCPFILTYLDPHSKQEVMFLDEIKETEVIWREKHGEKFLTNRIKGRKSMREYFQNGNGKTRKVVKK